MVFLQERVSEFVFMAIYEQLNVILLMVYESLQVIGLILILLYFHVNLLCIHEVEDTKYVPSICMECLQFVTKERKMLNKIYSVCGLRQM